MDKFTHYIYYVFHSIGGLFGRGYTYLRDSELFNNHCLMLSIFEILERLQDGLPILCAIP